MQNSNKLKIKHLSPMLSLSNAFNIEDMKDFSKKLIILSFKNKDIELFCEPKLMEFQHL